jgi:hypothetical protein
MTKVLPLIAVLLATVFAMPFQQISKRALPSFPYNHYKRDGCAAYLTPNEFEFPHYITQISSVNPDRSYGPSYFGNFTPNDISTIFAFDIPASRADANCTLEFLFPARDQLYTSNYTYEGGGTFFFVGYNVGSCPGPATTFNSQPQRGEFPPFPVLHMEPGFAYTIDIGPCFVSAGSCVSGREFDFPICFGVW